LEKQIVSFCNMGYTLLNGVYSPQNKLLPFQLNHNLGPCHFFCLLTVVLLMTACKLNRLQHKSLAQS